MKSNPIPTHEFYDTLERSIPFDFIPLKRKNNYDSSRHHRHAYYEVFFFINGGGTHEIDFEIFPIKSNALHFVSPGQIHLVKRAVNSNGYVLLFSREFYHLGISKTDILYDMPFLNNNTKKPIVNLASPEIDFFKNMFEKTGEEYSSSHADKEEILRSFLNIILIRAKRLFNDTGTNTPHSAHELVDKFRIAVEKNFMHLHKVSGYAEMLCISAGHLNDVISKVSGKSASDFIHERLMLEAKRLLLHSDETISGIAYILHFEDASYFTRFFHNQMGITPGEFRKKIREKYL